MKSSSLLKNAALLFALPFTVCAATPAVIMCILLYISSSNALTSSPDLCALIQKPSLLKKPFSRGLGLTLNSARQELISISKILTRRFYLTVIQVAAAIACSLYSGVKLPASIPWSGHHTLRTFSEIGKKGVPPAGGPQQKIALHLLPP